MRRCQLSEEMGKPHLRQRGECEGHAMAGSVAGELHRQWGQAHGCFSLRFPVLSTLSVVAISTLGGRREGTFSSP